MNLEPCFYPVKQILQSGLGKVANGKMHKSSAVFMQKKVEEGKIPVLLLFHPFAPF